MNQAAVATDTSAVTVTEVKAKGRPGRPVSPDSKTSRAKNLVFQRLAEGKSRAEILAEIVSEIGTTPGTAQVYFHNAQTAYKQDSTAPQG